MKKYFGKFASSGDVQTAVDSGALSKPYVAVVGNEVDYNSKDIDYASMPLTFEILSGDTIIWKLESYNTSGSRTIQYSKNGGAWISITSAKDDSCSIDVVPGDIIQFKGDTGGLADNSSIYNYFYNSQTTYFNAYGNPMSLISSTGYTSLTTVWDRALMCLFRYSNIVNAEHLKLPATTVNQYGYYQMFYYCNKLITAPTELPATSLGNAAYSYMFSNCDKLEKAPDLPYSGALPYQAYRNMFNGCNRLNYIKCLATDISATQYGYGTTDDWVNWVSSTGTFVKHPSMNDWPSGANGIPNGWTVVDAVL